MAKTKVVHKLNKDGVTTACKVTVSASMSTKPTYRGVTCKRCIKAKGKNGGKK